MPTARRAKTVVQRDSTKQAKLVRAVSSEAVQSAAKQLRPTGQRGLSAFEIAAALRGGYGDPPAQALLPDGLSARDFDGDDVERALRS
ncbi:MAG: hypothetical protein LC798_12795 [Chloroflexi bacterium]|nr:hypothetical protein [Chloroflexota bacterium]